MSVNTDFNLGEDSDDLYADLLRAHHGLTEQESAALNARLVLVLMNHVGDPDVIRSALQSANRAK